MFLLGWHMSLSSDHASYLPRSEFPKLEFLAVVRPQLPLPLTSRTCGQVPHPNIAQMHTLTHPHIPQIATVRGLTPNNPLRGMIAVLEKGEVAGHFQ